MAVTTPPLPFVRAASSDGIDFRRLVAAAPFGVIIWHAEGDTAAELRMLYVNTAASRIADACYDEFVGLTMAEAFPTTLGAEPEVDIPAALIRAATTERPVTLAAAPYAAEGRPSDFFRLHCVPLGERRVAAVYEKVTDDVVCRRDLETFAEVASHDLQAPLRTITGFVELLDRALGPEPTGKRARYLGLIRTGVEQMSGYVRGLLAYARTGHDEVVSALDARAVAGDVRRSLRGALDDVGGRIEIDPLPVVHAPAVALHQVLQNIVENAIKYRSPDRPLAVRIAARRRDDDWAFTVTDNGVGIALEHQTEVFALFRRLHGGHIMGAGLGLAICRRAVERWGGTITLDSTPGAGTTITFTVPGI